jgi:phenylacetate-CoA ligase
VKVLKSYLFDIDRLRKFNETELEGYQNTTLKRIISYAYTIPLYYKKYKQLGIRPHDINGIRDLSKLPIITKKDIQMQYPNGIIPAAVPKNRLIEISTSGTTGKKISIFANIFDVILWFFIYIRILREYNINWRKDKLTIIGDFAPHTIGSGFVYQGLQSNLRNDVFFPNIQWLNTNDNPKTVIKKINDFNPDFIGGYPGMLGHLAVLQEKGWGNDINPRYIATIGSVLDKYLKVFIEQTFSAHVFEVYGATESGTIGYQCKRGRMHVMSDLVFLEFYRDENPISTEDPTNILVTKLYGGGTPVIRYNALNDIVSQSFDHCPCGLPGQVLKRIYGRDDLSLIFPDGKALLASSFSEIYSRVLYELKTTKIKETKIIQHDFSTIEIQLVIDEEQRNEPPTVETIMEVIKDGFQKIINTDVKIIMKEVNSIDKGEPRIISKIQRNQVKIRQYI